MSSVTPKDLREYAEKRGWGDCFMRHRLLEDGGVAVEPMPDALLQRWIDEAEAALRND